MADIVFNSQQEEAIQKAVKWYKDLKDRKTRKPFFFVAGYAGTGKTSIAKEIVKRTCGEFGAIYIAPTGKAASRLRQKGCHGAKTLHQFIYNVFGEDEEGDPIFSAKAMLDESPRLVVLDEGSMVGDFDASRLLAHRIPVLVLGDIGQIPPVKAASFFTQPDYLLTEIMRQGKESNIIRASFFVRQGKRLPPREYDDVVVREGKPPINFLKKFMDKDSQILCSFNSTRDMYNRMLRNVAGYCSELPSPGEKLVCTFNQHSTGFMNGEQLIVKEYVEIPAGEVLDDEPLGNMYVIGESLTDGREIKARINVNCFTGNEIEREAALKKPGGMDYGYVITVHKSQGSEWPNVVVLEELLRGVPYEKLMYTAVTRAMEKLWVYRGA